ncbi:MAG: endolytic transglycosylase MltG [Bradymonadaceae bacterium]|nr:endolytic transglycosylase MltG [Lujinxingiaceae bacterium]
MAMLAGGLLLGAIAFAGLYFHYTAWADTLVLEADQSRTVVIERNTSWPGVIAALSEARLVKRPMYFDYWGRKQGLSGAVRAGTFRLAGPMRLEELDAELRRGGMAEEVTVTFPEGFTIFHVAERVESSGLASREDFLRAARDPDTLLAAGIEAESFEGYLFPDTYRFEQGTSAAAIVLRMHRRWKGVWEELKSRHAHSIEALGEQYKFGQHELVILASLVERETGVDDERALVSRVFLNRLDLNMRLQTDPTCVYGEETYMLVPTPAMCRDPLNRYSTYVIHGLTPGPIANPGRASLDAALAPSTQPDANKLLYFVSRRDGTGRHHFSKNYDEHRQAIRRYLKSGK